MGEPLNEPGQFGDGLIARGKHLLLVDKIENSGKLHRQKGERLLLPPTILIHSNRKSISEFSKNYNGMVNNYYISTMLLLGLHQLCHGGGQLGHFSPGHSLKGAPGGPTKGPLDTCLKD